METLTRNCKHPYSFGSRPCIVCGKNLDETGVSLRRIHQAGGLNRDERNRIRKSDMRIMESQRKLYVFLDLDNTLLNSTRINKVTTDEDYLKTLTLEDRESLLLFTVASVGYMTKLRPFVRTFLKEASEMFEMYIYTNAKRHYARAMAKLLDPEGVYFGGRIISRDDSTVRYEKNLDVVLVNEEPVLIVDDLEHVWSHKHRDNLIQIERYDFFASSSKKFFKSLSELKMDESESDGALSTVLNVLKRTHCLFFQDTSRKVRSVLKQVLKRVQDVNNISLKTPTEAECLLRMQNEANPGELKSIPTATSPRDKTITEKEQAPAEDKTRGTREEAASVSPQHRTPKAVTKKSNHKAIIKLSNQFVALDSLCVS
ncbi:PREDICTED: RNA polymerase II C-terminal domain phosphatase-like 4 [Camelina sativa]|uniref:RNA polymerase II C-terminal domain phosphatase-like n=1 Tax=Camelina sativa TaxID=90675 RepID=A0ABM0X4B4_CAMSA|nr:PREDICTED: RNA polymerase II C-terminal domain phosphatase-like 4 [Camelina sativa]